VPNADTGVVDPHVHRAHAIGRISKNRAHLIHGRYVGGDYRPQAEEIPGQPGACVGVPIEDTIGATLFEEIAPPWPRPIPRQSQVRSFPSSRACVGSRPSGHPATT
jgi:hypothetical protein